MKVRELVEIINEELEKIKGTIFKTDNECTEILRTAIEKAIKYTELENSLQFDESNEIILVDASSERKHKLLLEIWVNKSLYYKGDVDLLEMNPSILTPISPVYKYNMLDVELTDLSLQLDKEYFKIDIEKRNINIEKLKDEIKELKNRIKEEEDIKRKTIEELNKLEKCTINN